MKIILVDNFDRENISDVLIAENVDSVYGKKIVDLLNEKESPHSENFFRLVDDDYKLHKFQP
jgi:hypothetical protein